MRSAPGEHLVQPLRFGLDAVAEQRDERVAGVAEERRAEHGARHLDVGVAADAVEDPRGARTSTASVSNGSVPFGRDPDLESAAEQQLGERLVDAAAQHDHVEQHRRGDRDAENRERRAEPVAAETPDAPADALSPAPPEHHRPGADQPRRRRGPREQAERRARARR